MNRSVVPFLPLLLAVGLGCTQPNRDVFHTLRALRSEPATPAPARFSMALEVMPVRLPKSLQRPQLVTEILPGTLRLLGGHRWGNGLDLDIQRVLIENLSRVSGCDTIVAFPHGERIQAAHRLELEVHQLTGKLGGNLSLQATWMLFPARGGPALILKKISLERPVQGLEPDALVLAHSQILDDLSQKIAGELGLLVNGTK